MTSLNLKGDKKLKRSNLFKYKTNQRKKILERIGSALRNY